MTKAIPLTDFESLPPDVLVAFYNQEGPERWLLVVGLMNVAWKMEQTPEVIARLRSVLEMLEEAEP